MSPSGAVLFDLDGTLVDSRPGIVAALNETLVAEGLPPRPESDLVPRIGPPLQITLGRLLGRAPDDVEAVAAAYRERYRRTMLDGGSVVYPGIPELLSSLTAAGRPLAVATSKAQPLALELLEHLGLASAFAAIRGPVPPSREDKAATVARALEALGVPAGDAVLVGDREHDVHGGLAHGVGVIGVLWGYGTEAELREAGATTVAADVATLQQLLV